MREIEHYTRIWTRGQVVTKGYSPLLGDRHVRENRVIVLGLVCRRTAVACCIILEGRKERKRERRAERRQSRGESWLRVCVRERMSVWTRNLLYRGEGAVDQVVKPPHDFPARTTPSKGELSFSYILSSAHVPYSTRDRIARVCQH